MKDRPILFSGPMICSLFEDRKTMTRRAVKGMALDWITSGFTPEFVADPANHLCPYGIPGDRLWVRETFAPGIGPNGIVYRATLEKDGYPYEPLAPDEKITWKPSIFMPRWASRITLEITNVRVEWLNDISEEDAKNEGIEQIGGLWKNYLPEGVLGWTAIDDPRASFRTLWESINGPGSWDANPWVWVVEFKRIEE